MNDPVVLEREGGIGLLRFTRPAQRNPFNETFARAFIDRLDEVVDDDAVRCVVITGGEHFCGGGDLPEFRQRVAGGARDTQALLDMVARVALAAVRFPKPLIAAVNGAAYGAGMSLALAADVVVAAEDARFCLVFVRVGGCPDTGASWLLQQRIGSGRARLLALTGREVSGRDAIAMGLAEQLAPAGAAEEPALILAREISANPLFALTTTKRVMAETAETGFEQALAIEGRAQTILLSGHDFPEGMAAFAEKRTPNFRDR